MFTVKFNYIECTEGNGTIISRNTIHEYDVKEDEVAIFIEELTTHGNRDTHPTYGYPLEIGNAKLCMKLLSLLFHTA